MILKKRTPLAQDSRVAGTHGMEEILFIQISTVLALSVYMWYTGASRNLPANMRSAHIDGKKNRCFVGSSFFVQETNDFNLYQLARNVDICLYSLTQAIDGSG